MTGREVGRYCSNAPSSAKRVCTSSALSSADATVDCTHPPRTCVTSRCCCALPQGPRRWDDGGQQSAEAFPDPESYLDEDDFDIHQKWLKWSDKPRGMDYVQPSKDYFRCCQTQCCGSAALTCDFGACV